MNFHKFLDTTYVLYYIYLMAVLPIHSYSFGGSIQDIPAVVKPKIHFNIIFERLRLLSRLWHFRHF
jgi:hypothetical protein